jgi:hypothetical protein
MSNSNIPGKFNWTYGKHSGYGTREDSLRGLFLHRKDMFIEAGGTEQEYEHKKLMNILKSQHQYKRANNE